MKNRHLHPRIFHLVLEGKNAEKVPGGYWAKGIFPEEGKTACKVKRGYGYNLNQPGLVNCPKCREWLDHHISLRYKTRPKQAIALT